MCVITRNIHFIKIRMLTDAYAFLALNKFLYPFFEPSNPHISDPKKRLHITFGGSVYHGTHYVPAVLITISE